MSSNFDIKFFKNEKGNSIRLGGGYITSGGLKTNFSVFKTEKNKKYGFNISLPYRKQDDGTVVQEVQFTTAKLSDEAHDFIKNILDGGQGSDGNEARLVTEANATRAAGPVQSVDVRAGVKRFGTGAPF